jgi:hypothetical protein
MKIYSKHWLKQQVAIKSLIVVMKHFLSDVLCHIALSFGKSGLKNY